MTEPDPPRVLVIGPTPPPVHGTAVYTAGLVSALVEGEGLDVRHLDTSDRRSLDNTGRLELGNVLLGLRNLGQLLVALITWRPRVVYLPLSQNAPAFARDALFVLSSRLLGARVVAHLHGAQMRSFLSTASWSVRKLVAFTHRFIHRGWVHADEFREQFDGLLADEQVRVVHNGVSDRFPELVGREPLEGRPLRVLHLGQIGVNKGVDVVLAALELLVDRKVDAHLTLAGPWRSNEDQRVLGPAIERLEGRGLLTLLGPVFDDDKDDVLRRADVFVLATHHPFTEGHPLALLEAISASLPVVATPRAAIPATVEDGVTGFVVPDGSAEGLADALARLARGPALTRSLGAAGRARYLDRFTQESALERAVGELAAACR